MITPKKLVTGDGNLKTCLFTAEPGSNFWVKSTLRELRVANPSLGGEGAGSEAASAAIKKSRSGRPEDPGCEDFTHEQWTVVCLLAAKRRLEIFSSQADTTPGSFLRNTAGDG